MKEFHSFVIDDGLTQIEDLSGTKFYLVEGKESAALLDTGIGLGDISAYVKTLTDKPLIVLITHGHLDHAMGSGTFDASVPLYMSPLDLKVYEKHTSLPMRKNYWKSTQNLFSRFKDPDQLPWKTPALPQRFLPLKPGDCFDLGGETVEICPGAGHTPGCVTILLQNHRILLLGDAVNNFTYLFDENTLPVSTLRNTLSTLRESVNGRYDRTLFCHGMRKRPGFGDIRMIEGGIMLCDLILAGKDRHIQTEMIGHPCFSAKRMFPKDDLGDHSACNILYSERTKR